MVGSFRLGLCLVFLLLWAQKLIHEAPPQHSGGRRAETGRLVHLANPGKESSRTRHRPGTAEESHATFYRTRRPPEAAPSALDALLGSKLSQSRVTRRPTCPCAAYCRRP